MIGRKLMDAANQTIVKKRKVATSWEANCAADCSSFRENFSVNVNNVGSKVDMLVILKSNCKLFQGVLWLLSERNSRKKLRCVYQSIATNKSIGARVVPLRVHQKISDVSGDG